MGIFFLTIILSFFMNSSWPFESVEFCCTWKYLIKNHNVWEIKDNWYEGFDSYQLILAYFMNSFNCFKPVTSQRMKRKQPWKTWMGGPGKSSSPQRNSTPTRNTSLAARVLTTAGSWTTCGLRWLQTVALVAWDCSGIFRIR